MRRMNRTATASFVCGAPGLSGTRRTRCSFAFDEGLCACRPPGQTCRPGDALEVLCPKVPQFKEIAEKSPGSLGHNDHVRFGDPLQTRREVWRFANDCLFLRSARSDQVADNY